MTATQQPDPFGAPTASASGPSGLRAGFWLRFGASLIDGILVGVILLVRALIRDIGRIASTIPFFLGCFWMRGDPEKQTWHDTFAGSVVVPTSAYPVG